MWPFNWLFSGISNAVLDLRIRELEARVKVLERERQLQSTLIALTKIRLKYGQFRAQSTLKDE